MISKIRFLSNNKHKIEEAKFILNSLGIEVIQLIRKVDELQTENTHNLIYDKTLKAFSLVGRPVFVEHTGLYLEYLNGLPGGLTQIFWDKLEADKFSKIFGNTDNPKVIAKTIIGYIDSVQFHSFEGEIHGIISTVPKGNRDFQWDCVFIPDGYDSTFAELGLEKNKISMRKIALDKFADFLKKQ